MCQNQEVIALSLDTYKLKNKKALDLEPSKTYII
jgi:hypothetical protein